ncbi:MAG: chemotaxis protein CheD [Chloroflexi bacterium]|nr:chemotaxis protein CheD [Chloroflexota bacterium]
MQDSQAIAVGLGEVQVAKGDGAVLVAYGLGSCVAVCAYDTAVQVAGMAHVMLPQSNGSGDPSGKYADKAIPILLDQLAAMGARQERLRVKIAGGARMLVAQGFADKLDIGARNVKSVTDELSRRGLKILASDTGGNKGRTIQMVPKTGAIKVRSIGGPEREL